MSRNPASTKAGGARFERSTADCLAAKVDDRIDRRIKTGSKDCGDLAGLRPLGERAVGVKDYGGRYLVGPWLREADVERATDDAIGGLVTAKRRGVTNPHEQVVFMTMRDLIALLTRARP